MYRMSSLSRRFSTLVDPLESAARRRHRLESGLDPGSVTVPSRLVMGDTVSVLASSLVVMAWRDDGDGDVDVTMLFVDSVDGDVIENALLVCGVMMTARSAPRADGDSLILSLVL